METTSSASCPCISASDGGPPLKERLFDITFEEWFPKLVRYCLRVLKARKPPGLLCEDEAEDIVVEAFTRFWEDLRDNKYKDQGAKARGSFLYILTRNSIYEYLVHFAKSWLVSFAVKINPQDAESMDYEDTLGYDPSKEVDVHINYLQIAERLHRNGEITEAQFAWVQSVLGGYSLDGGGGESKQRVDRYRARKAIREYEESLG